MERIEYRIDEKVLAPSYMGHVPRHRKYVVGRIIDIIDINDITLIQVWQYNHEPKSMTGWFESRELREIKKFVPFPNSL